MLIVCLDFKQEIGGVGDGGRAIAEGFHTEIERRKERKRGGDERRSRTLQMHNNYTRTAPRPSER